MKRYRRRDFLRWAATMGMLAALAWSAPAHAQAARRLTQGQARQLARLVARHEHIDLQSQWMEFDPMDVGAPYLPGFWSFAVVREAQKPGPDTTLRRYAVNRTTGDVWEMTLCRKYDFAALARMRKKLTGHAEASAAENAAERKALGCEASGSAGQTASGAGGL